MLLLRDHRGETMIRRGFEGGTSIMGYGWWDGVDG
jgi:hypothetical protein